MNTLAIDQGADCGWATNVNGYVEWGTANFGLRRGESDGMRLLRFDRWLWDRCFKIPAAPKSPMKVQPYQPIRIVDLVIFEGAVHFVKDRPNLAGLEYIATMKLFCTRNNIEYTQVSPTALKSFAIPDTRPKESAKERRARIDRKEKKVKMNRGKPAMTAAALGRLVALKQIPGVNFPLTDDAADALWLLWYAEERLWRRKK